MISLLDHAALEDLPLTPPRRIRPGTMVQRWDDLAFISWSYAAADVARLLPPGLEVDTFDGVAWVSVVPFRPTGMTLYAPSEAPGRCCRISAQLRATRHCMPSQIPAAAQSRSTAQVLPMPHGSHSPPQSTSVSLPFFTLSVQRAT